MKKKSQRWTDLITGILVIVVATILGLIVVWFTRIEFLFEITVLIVILPALAWAIRRSKHRDEN